MRWRDVLPLSFAALLINKSRTVLTMLGIIIGIASVILMIGVGQAAQSYLLSRVASFGSDLVFLQPGKGDETRGGPPSTTIKQSLKMEDVDALKKLDWTKAVDANVISSDLVSYGGTDKIASISGVTPDEQIVFSVPMEKGTYITEDAMSSRARVAVLGNTLAKELFGEEDPIGKTIKISKQPFRVIGVMAPIGTRFFFDVDKEIDIPVTTALTLYNRTTLNFISVKTGDVPITEAKNRVRVTIREKHNINNPNNDLSKDDFKVTSQEDAAKNIAVIGTVLQILLASIASISLVVAGVGIMNIMYVTVTERTREIGLRKAVGAKRRDVLTQFLFEAIMLTVVAGSLGIAFGIAVNWVAIQIISQFQAGWTFSIPWNGAFIGFGVSSAIGVIFGYFPARSAASLSPIESLRYE
jgi:putative ABC transport system permease protein